MDKNTGEPLLVNGQQVTTTVFVLSDASGSVLQTVRNDSNGAVVFAPQSFDAPGTYLFRISERSADVPVIIYDSTVFEAVIVVTSGDAGHTATVTYSRVGDGGANSGVATPEFVNSSMPIEPGGSMEFIEIGDDGTPLGRWVPEYHRLLFVLLKVVMN